VIVSGALAERPARMVDPSEPVRLAGPPPRFVGRGGEKLAAALERFGLDPSGRRALDAGASTGGFTDCLLQNGVMSVTALDVGHGQLHERLRADPRVEVVERTNLRHVDPAATDPYGIVVADLSFISLNTVMGVLVSSTAVGGNLVVLVKPQFEAGRRDVARGRGVVTDPQIWTRTVTDVVATAVAAGAAMMDVMVSPIHGADGNTEFLVHLCRGGPADRCSGEDRTAELIGAAVADAVARSGAGS